MKKIAVTGGDIRQVYLTELLLEEGFETVHFSGEETDLQALEAADTVILPLPVSRDGIVLNAPMSSRTLLLSEIIQACRGKQVLGGGVSEQIRQLANRHGLEITDYYAREELAVMNAEATAEGALGIAISHTPFTVSGSRCLVIGYGRIGKALARKLDGLGAIVSAGARKASDLALIRSVGLDAVHTSDIGRVLPECDIVFNTVPSTVLAAPQLACCKKDVLIIELASAPGGIDTTTAGRLGLRVVNAPGLPGKTAPLSAARYIKDTLLNIFREEI